MLERELVFVEVFGGGVVLGGVVYPFEDGIFGGIELPRVRGGDLVMVVNMRCSVIRMADAFGDSFRDFSLSTRWELVEQNFPLGEKLNERTHIFDADVFTNKNGQSRFFMTALPVSVSDAVAKIGVAMAGSIHRVKRIDTAEHMAFRKYAPEISAPAFIFLPQDGGIRVLFISDGLPISSHYISNNPLYREDELLRYYYSLKVPPTEVIFPEESEDFAWIRSLREFL